MEKTTSRNLRVGILVITGTVLLIVALYIIGNKRNIFGSTFRISAQFHNVNGLMAGNNVRFAGIDVGTVESVEIASDSSVNVTMIIEESVQPYIKKNAIASIGTDGLMGNKLVSINSSNNHSPSIEEGDVLQTQKQIETDEMLRTLNRTNDNVSVISENLKEITFKVKNPNTLWSILQDTVVAQNVKQAVVNIKQTGSQTSNIAGNLNSIVNNIKSGKGTAGTLLTDTTISKDLEETIADLKTMADTMSKVSSDLSNFSQKVKSGEGTIGTLLTDTTLVNSLNNSMKNIEKGSQGFSENMEALKHNFLFRRYFKKQEKKNKK